MRILILHNEYHHAGGEDTVVALESQYLASRGHSVRLETISNLAIAGVASKNGAFIGASGNPTSANRIRRLISDFRPSVVHIHNFFPLLSPSVHLAISESNIAVVQTLHNFRLLCAGGLFLRDGAVCEECLGRAPWPALKHRCYRDSFPATAAVLAMQRSTRSSQEWLDSISAFIALTQFSKDKFVAGGMPRDKIFVKSNFAIDPGMPLPFSQRTGGAIFVGRLSREKGVLELVQAWHKMPHLSLDIFGDGPELELLRSFAPKNVSFHGRVTNQEALRHIGNSKILIFPSVWYEGFPMVLVEAMASGTPIVAADIGAAHEILFKTPFSRLYAPGNMDELRRAVLEISSSEHDLVAASRMSYLKNFTPELNISQLERIYESAIESRI